jgi:type IV pilus assembly protein PilN
MRQEGAKVTLIGHAQSNERVSELLRNLANRTPWLERPELIEIKAARAGGATATKDARTVFEFSLNALIKTADPQAQAQPPKTTAAPGAMAAAASR